MRYIIRVVLLMSTATLIAFQLTAAQDETITLTVAIQEWQQGVFNDALFDAFEANHPNVNIVPVVLSTANQMPVIFNLSDLTSLQQYFDAMVAFASTADVLPVSSQNLHFLAIQTGAFLDLSPLASLDPETDDFYPNALSGFQSANGTWALPSSMTVEIVSYDPIAFDTVGLAYPTENWTLQDYMGAGRTLTEANTPGFAPANPTVMLRAAYGQPLEGTLTDFKPVDFVNPPLEALLTEWNSYFREIQPLLDDESFDRSLAPITIVNPLETDASQGVSLLPGNTALLRIEGYTISSGTAYPELAYELASFLTYSESVLSQFPGVILARTSLSGSISGQAAGDRWALIEQALINGFPTSQLYAFQLALQAASTADAASSLAMLQTDMESAFTILSNFAGSTVFAVNTPEQAQISTVGDVVLRFAIDSPLSPLPNTDAWQRAAEAFSSDDLQVSSVSLDTTFLPPAERSQQQDCFYLARNSSLDSALLLDIGPLLSADPTYQREDFLFGILEQVQVSGQTLGLPLSVNPEVLWIDPVQFEAANVPTQQLTWTINDFTTAVDLLSDGELIVRSNTPGDTVLNMLIASYGGTPIILADQPYSYDLVSPQNVDAIRQMLDLARAGSLDYVPLGVAPIFQSGGFAEPIVASPLFFIAGGQLSESYSPFLYPSSPNGRPIAFSLGIGAISSETLFPEACYRWLRFVSQQPELLYGIPAQTSVQAEYVEYPVLFADWAEVINSEPVYVVPTAFTSNASSLYTSYVNTVSRLFMRRAFDRYVLESADLEVELQSAQQRIDVFLQCASVVEENVENEDFQQEINRCAVSTDPSIDVHLP